MFSLSLMNRKKSETRPTYAFSVLLGVLAISVGGLYVYFWRFGFNSDFAMIGLLAKRILTTGEQFIFVPKVGYQGLIQI